MLFDRMEIRFGFKMLTIQSVQIMNFSIVRKVLKSNVKRKTNHMKRSFTSQMQILVLCGLNQGWKINQMPYSTIHTSRFQCLIMFVTEFTDSSP